MHKFAIAQRVFLIVFILLSGCGGSPNVQVNELSSNTVSYDEPIHINNCGGKADSEQTASHSFATTFEGGAEFSAGYQSIVEGGVSAKYSQYRNISKSQRLIAPPATNMEFILRWSEDVHAGNVTVNGTTGNYEVRVPVAVEQVSSQDLGCDSAQNPDSNSAPTPTAVISNVFQGSVAGTLETNVLLNLSDNQVIIGTADKYQDVKEQTLPPFAVFVIYGAINENINLPWCGWDQWLNATPSFIEGELQKNIQKTKENHPSDWMSRGINVYRCHGSVLNCTIETVTK
jgi:hypothetical protein